MEFTLKHTRTYRYEVLNHAGSAKTVLYVLHGYGQLAHYFIKKFKNIPENILIVAPEGMHRFYVKGASGRVGASWMTKEARELDISDNISWLDAMDEKISGEFPIEKRILLGFSQGGATAIRWMNNGRVKFDSLISWASNFPPDVEFEYDSIWEQQDNFFVIGKNDEFYNDRDQEELISQYKNLGFKISRYLGIHDIDNETLLNIIRQIPK